MFVEFFICCIIALECLVPSRSRLWNWSGFHKNPLVMPSPTVPNMKQRRNEMDKKRGWGGGGLGGWCLPVASNKWARECVCTAAWWRRQAWRSLWGRSSLCVCRAGATDDQHPRPHSSDRRSPGAAAPFSCLWFFKSFALNKDDYSPLPIQVIYID